MYTEYLYQRIFVKNKVSNVSDMYFSIYIQKLVGQLKELVIKYMQHFICTQLKDGRSN
jgi:hypothetical protein